MGRSRARNACKWLATALLGALAAVFVWSGWEQLSFSSVSGLHSVEFWAGDVLVRWHTRATAPGINDGHGLTAWLPRIGLCPNFVQPSFRWHYPKHFVSHQPGQAYWLVLPLWMPLACLTPLTGILWWSDLRRAALVDRATPEAPSAHRHR